MTDLMTDDDSLLSSDDMDIIFGEDPPHERETRRGIPTVPVRRIPSPGYLFAMDLNI